jgi:hypothetical protein
LRDIFLPEIHIILQYTDILRCQFRMQQMWI